VWGHYRGTTPGGRSHQIAANRREGIAGRRPDGLFLDARVVAFNNAGHWLHHDQFDTFMSAIRAFL